MIKLIANKILIALFMLFVAIGAANAGTGDIFSITGSGTVATLDIQLCLSVDGTTSWNCEKHTVTRQILSIRTVTPNHTYPAAGIKVLTAGYTLSGCTFLSNGYCQFSVSNTNAATVSATFLAAPTLASITPTTGAAAGGTGFSITGTNLTGATGITFNGTAATWVNVVNSTTVTGVTPAHAVEAVDVVITTPQGTTTLTNGYTYATTAVGQPAFGGTIACLNTDNNLIAATVDNSSHIEWGGFGTAIVVDAQSNIDGASNTIAIVTALDGNSGRPYAAQLCYEFQVDSQGNNPCQPGNTCYDDWFLPAGNNSTSAGQLNCLFDNKLAIGGFANNAYWSSTVPPYDPMYDAWLQNFINGNEQIYPNNNDLSVRCVRAFTP